MRGSMELEEPQQRPAPHKRKGGPLRVFGGGDLFAMILGGGCTLLVCSVCVLPSFASVLETGCCDNHRGKQSDCLACYSTLALCTGLLCFAGLFWTGDPAGRSGDVGTGRLRISGDALRDSRLACVRTTAV